MRISDVSPDVCSSDPRTSMVYPGSALTVNTDYDVAGNVTKIRENGATSGVGVLAAYAFDNLGRRTSVTFGNGSVQSFGYDAVSRSEERRVGKKWVSKCRYRWSQEH